MLKEKLKGLVFRRMSIKKTTFNKKGEGFGIARKSIYWTIASVVSVMAVIALVFIFTIYQGKLVYNSPELEAEVIILRFINNPECFAYQDEVTSRVYLGTIDLEKYTQDNLDKCYFPEEDKGYETYNFGFNLESLNPLNDEGEEIMLRTNNYFNYVDFTIYKEVIVRNGHTLTPTTLIIYVQEKI
jgi:hypothetical protein